MQRENAQNCGIDAEKTLKRVEVFWSLPLRTPMQRTAPFLILY